MKIPVVSDYSVSLDVLEFDRFDRNGAGLDRNGAKLDRNACIRTEQQLWVGWGGPAERPDWVYGMQMDRVAYLGGLGRAYGGARKTE